MDENTDNQGTAKGHKVSAYERGDGYAASCDTCGDITFGGFRTKAEAKAALHNG